MALGIRNRKQREQASLLCLRAYPGIARRDAVVLTLVYLSLLVMQGRLEALNIAYLTRNAHVELTCSTPKVDPDLPLSLFEAH